MKHLTLSQRYELQAMRLNGSTISEVALKLNVARSTISRELRRNKDERSDQYTAELAHNKCRERHANKKKYIRFTEQIKHQVKTYLKMDFRESSLPSFEKAG